MSKDLEIEELKQQATMSNMFILGSIPKHVPLVLISPSFQAIQVFQLAADLEACAICLCQEALSRLILTLSGTEAGGVVKLLIFTFCSSTDYDQLKDQYLQDEDKEEPEEGTDPKEEGVSLFTVPLSPSTTELKDICLLEAAKPAFPSNPLLISTTRVPAEFISDNMPSRPNKKSTYYCLFGGCNTSTLQKASLCSHIHRKHLAMAIQCCFCRQAWWRSNPFLPHIRTKHAEIEPTNY